MFTLSHRTTSLASLLLTGLLASCTLLQAQRNSKNSASDQLEQLSRSLQEVANKVAPAIVRIDVVGYSQSDDNDLKEKSEAHLVSKRESLASGIILDSDGYIATNAHVLKGAKRVRVILDHRLAGQWEVDQSKAHDGVFEAKIRGLFSEGDFALLKIDATGLPVLPLAESSKIRQGQLVFAVGNPEGLNNSISMGVVSAVSRPREGEAFPLFIQTDAAINPGSSGGALVDVHGQLIGMTSFILTEGGGSEGLGFALPSSLLQLLYRELRDNGRVRVGDIGVTAQSLNPTMARGLHLPQSSGLIISDVATGGPGNEAGVRVKDILVSLDGSPIATLAQYAMALYAKHAGDRAELRLLRGARYLAVSVQIEDRIEDPEDPLDQIDVDQSIVKVLGIVATNVKDKGRKNDESLRSKSAVLVSANLAHTDVETGLLVGDVIRSVNENDVDTVERLRAIMQGFRSGDAVVLQVERHGRFKYLSFEMD